MAAVTTPTTPQSWSPDLVAYPATETVPDALVVQLGRRAGVVEGDAPSVRVPYMLDDGSADIVPEGETIPEGPGTASEIVVQTHKTAVLGAFSRELLSQTNAATMVTDAMRRGITNKADEVFLNNADAPVGLLATDGIVSGGAVGGDLDRLVDAIAVIEADGGQATHLLASPSSWATLSKLRAATDSNESLLGAGTNAAERRVLGVPVLTSAAVPDGDLLALDAGSVITAYGDVAAARSDDARFDQDLAVIRLTFRFGFGVTHPGRLVRLTTTGTE